MAVGSVNSGSDREKSVDRERADREIGVPRIAGVVGVLGILGILGVMGEDGESVVDDGTASFSSLFARAVMWSRDLWTAVMRARSSIM